MNDSKYSLLARQFSELPPLNKPAGNGLMGLASSGESNSCFFNSLTQALLHTPELESFFHDVICILKNLYSEEQLSNGQEKVLMPYRYNIATEYLDLYEKYWTSNDNPVSKRLLYQRMNIYFKKQGIESLMTGNQEDVTECLQYMLIVSVTLYLNYLKSLQSIPRRFFLISSNC